MTHNMKIVISDSPPAPELPTTSLKLVHSGAGVVSLCATSGDKNRYLLDFRPDGTITRRYEASGVGFNTSSGGQVIVE